MVVGDIGLVGKVVPWLQGELGPLGYPTREDTDKETKRRTRHTKLINKLSN